MMASKDSIILVRRYFSKVAPLMLSITFFISIYTPTVPSDIHHKKSHLVTSTTRTHHLVSEPIIQKVSQYNVIKIRRFDFLLTKAQGWLFSEGSVKELERLYSDMSLGLDIMRVTNHYKKHQGCHLSTLFYTQVAKRYESV